MRLRAAPARAPRRRVLALVLVCLSAGAAILWMLFERDMGELRARLIGRSQQIETVFGAVEYAQSGEGTPVLAIHGSGGGFDQALEMVGSLSDYGYRLIAPSRFGYLGSSFPPNAGPELQADAFAVLLDHLGEEQVVVFGGSAGALSAMQFAIRYPERCTALVLLVPASFAPGRKPNTSAFEGPIAEFVILRLLRSDFLLWLATTFAPDTMTRTILATEPAVVEAAGPAEQERARRVLRHILPVSRRADGLWLDTRTAGEPPPYPLERIKCPVLAISAEDDLYGTAASARHAAASVPNGKLLLYPTGGHILAGRDGDVWGEVSIFLNSTPKPAAPATTR